jgi:hypothetical protein
MVTIRHMLACADELNAGGDVASESWRVTKAGPGAAVGRGGAEEKLRRGALSSAA